ncbi:MAG: hypothetical protein GY953_07950, partial [bacterium]|nr:hypothetical protein [bacterium]
MILSLTLALAPLPVSPAIAPDVSFTPATTTAVDSASAQDFEAEIAAAGEDVEKLSTLAAGWKEAGENDAARAAWRRIIEIDADHEAAHKGLRHHSYDGKWFETYTALSKYRREEEKLKKEQGLVRFQDEWVDIKEVRYLKLGWVKNDSNTWASPASLALMAEETKMVEAGWTMHDLYWVDPAEEPMVAAGKFKCGDEWLDGAAADEYHSDLSTWWELPGTYFAIYTTLSRNTETAEAEWARYWADSTYPDLVRIYGVKPGDVSSLTELRGQSHNMPGVVALRDVAQYNEFAAGSQDPPRQPAEQEGFSSLHYAFFADSYINFID